MRLIWLMLLSSIFSFSCTMNADDDMFADEPMLRFKYQFDSNQERLDNLGQASAIPAGNAALSPDFQILSGHFIELVPTALTPYQAGAFIYKGAEVPASNPNSFGFTTAIDFEQAILGEEGIIFLEVPLSAITPGTYNHIRVSVAYQKFDLRYNLINVPVIGELNNQEGTVASFVGYNTHINNLQVQNMELEINAPKLQGFWAFETQLEGAFDQYNQLFSGQAPENATTVVNPFPNAPIPQGSCVVSGSLNQALIINGDETQDIELSLSFSVNDSFEWVDSNGNGEWDLDVQTPANSEAVVDMGLRGLKAFVN